jgi:hypothetical protein
MKIKIITLLSFVILTSFNFKSELLNPTGTYNFGKTKNKNGDIYGYYGKIQVLKYLENKIIMSFLFCKGAPSYNSGSFIDTLNYEDNIAVYRPQVYSKCRIEFAFSKKGVNVKTNEYDSECGFGMGVVANGFFKKKSSEQPEIIDLLTGEKFEKTTNR